MKFSTLYKQQPEKSDKGTRHDYIDNFYCPEFTPIRNKQLYIVEIGIYRGRSLKLLRQWFTNANIVGIDNCSSLTASHWKEIAKMPDVGIIYDNAYSSRVVNIFPDNSIDYLIDDGPHTIESQIACIELYWPKIKPGGKLIIEDVQYLDRDAHLFHELSKKLQCYSHLYDLRNNKGRYDDVLIVFTKPILTNKT